MAPGFRPYADASGLRWRWRGGMRSAMAAVAVVEPTQASDAVCAERRREPSRGVSPLAVAAAVGRRESRAPRPLLRARDAAAPGRRGVLCAPRHGDRGGTAGPHRPLWPPLYAELMGRVFAVLALALHLHAHVLHAVLLGCAGFGLAALRLRRAGWWTVPAGLLAYNAGVFLVVNANPRYAVQMMPAAVLFAGVGAAWLWARARGAPLPPSPAFAFTRRGLALGMAAALVLELVAFRELPALGL